MGLLKTKFIADDAITGAKVKLANNENLRARNAGDTADVNILKVNTSDAIEFASLPEVSSSPTTGNQLARKTYVDTKIDLTEKAAALGVATLDAGGKVPVAQLPNSVMEYLGTWVASTNTPTLADGTGNAGDVYVSTDSGTVDFGAGNISFVAGDWVIYSGAIWEKSVNSNQVASVFSRTGVVVAATNDYTWAQIDKTTSSIADITSKSHTLLDDVGTNTHAQIDTHIADATKHFTMLDEDNLASDSDTQAATQQSIKAYVDGAVSGAGSNGKETFTLDATDITNGFITLANTPKSNSINLIVDGGGAMLQGTDYTVLTATITFAGDLATVLAIGDKVQVQYEY